MSVPAAARSASWASLAGGLGAVLLPKCPLCFAAYGGALGAVGVSPAAYRPLVDVLVVVAVATSFGIVLALARGRRDALTPARTRTAPIPEIAGRVWLDVPTMTVAGAMVLTGGAIVNSIRCRQKGTVPG